MAAMPKKQKLTLWSIFEHEILLGVDIYEKILQFCSIDLSIIENGNVFQFFLNFLKQTKYYV